MLGAPSRWRQNETALGSPSSAKIKDRQLRALRRCYSRAHQFPAVAPVLIAWVDRELLDNGGLVVAAQHINAGNELGTEEPAELDELHVAVSGVIHERGIDRYGELSPFVGEGRDGSATDAKRPAHFSAWAPGARRQAWSVGMIQSSLMAVWRGRVTI